MYSTCVNQDTLRIFELYMWCSQDISSMIVVHVVTDIASSVHVNWLWLFLTHIKKSFQICFNGF